MLNTEKSVLLKKNNISAGNYAFHSHNKFTGWHYLCGAVATSFW